MDDGTTLPGDSTSAQRFHANSAHVRYNNGYKAVQTPTAHEGGDNPASGRRNAEDALLAYILVQTWALATGRALRSDVPITELSEDELIDFWADDHIAHGIDAEARICGLFGVDIVGFTGAQRNDDIRVYLRQELYTILRRSFDGAGLPWESCAHEDRGDGVLVVIPPELPLARVIDPLPERLRRFIRRHNRVFRDAAHMQLRAAFHIGPVQHDGHGYVGTDLNTMFRLLDAPTLKRAVAASGAELGLIVSGYVREALVKRHPSIVDPAAFRSVRVRVKETSTRAWVYLPGHVPAGPAALLPEMSPSLGFS